MNVLWITDLKAYVCIVFCNINNISMAFIRQYETCYTHLKNELRLLYIKI